MGYRNTVRSNVKKAFRYIQDLKIDLVLYKSAPLEYDFASAEASTSSTVIATIPGVLISEIKNHNKAGLADKELAISTFLINREDVEDMSIFNDLDTIKSGTRTWRFNGYEDNGYTITVTAARDG